MDDKKNCITGINGIIKKKISRADEECLKVMCLRNKEKNQQRPATGPERSSYSSALRPTWFKRHVVICRFPICVALSTTAGRVCRFSVIQVIG